MKKRILSILLCIVLIITSCLMPVTAATATTYNYFENGIMLDVARKYYTVDEIKQYIDHLSGYDRTYIQMHLFLWRPSAAFPPVSVWFWRCHSLL